MSRDTWSFVVLLSACGFCSIADAQSKSGSALKDLAEAEKGSNSGAFLAALKEVLSGDSARSVRAAVSSYAKFARNALQKMGSREFMTFHGAAADAFKPVKSKSAVDEFQKLLTTCPDWEGRLLLLDAAGIAKPVNRLDTAMTALHDEHPAVVRRALQYLVNAKQVPVVDAIVKRYLEVAKKKGKTGEAAQWERTGLAFQSALQRLLGVDLPVPEDYKNYFETRKNDPKLFDPKRDDNSVSRVTLFGAAVTGKNIIFVLDISGSMMTTDLLPEDEKKERAQGRTVVVGGDPAKQPAPKRGPPEDRQRMYRAKKELSNVVRSLPSDVRFNLITYSSDVHSWKKSMVPASDENKKAAAGHIESLKADGITVTDMALEEAFSDLNVDTIYLVTDGAPTHIGSLGPGMPEDAAQLIAQIHERVAELNFLRGVRIFTLGFKEANAEFLEKLAADNSGKFVNIR